MPQESDLSVLLIEDETDAAVLIQHVLSQGTRPSLAVSSGERPEYRPAADGDRHFQAILLDLNLPDSTGFDTFARVRQRAAGRAVVVLTGQEDEGLALRALRAGADDYLIKSELRVRFLASASATRWSEPAQAPGRSERRSAWQGLQLRGRERRRRNYHPGS